MSNRDDVLAALDAEVAKGRTQLAEECGLDPQQVSVELTALHNGGLAARGPDGWIKLTEPAPRVDKPPRRIHKKRRAKSETKAPKREAKPAKGATKRRKYATRRAKREMAAPLPVNGTARGFALLDSGDIGIGAIGDQPATTLTVADALRLSAFVERLRPVLESQ